MAGDSLVQGQPQSCSAIEKTTASLKTWYAGKFKKHLLAIRSSELLTAYFVRAYGELYEYGSEFIRVLHLINDGVNQKTVEGAARRLGWRWYRPATEKDSLVLRDENGKFRWMTDDEIAERSAWESENSELLSRLETPGAISAAAWRKDRIEEITAGRPGDIAEIGKGRNITLPCYLFPVRYPNEMGQDFWTAQDCLDCIPHLDGEEAVYRICMQLQAVDWRVNALLRKVEVVLEDDSLLGTDVDSRKKTRSIDLYAVDPHSAATSDRIMAEKEFQQFLDEMPNHV